MSSDQEPVAVRSAPGSREPRWTGSQPATRLTDREKPAGPRQRPPTGWWPRLGIRRGEVTLDAGVVAGAAIVVVGDACAVFGEEVEV